MESPTIQRAFTALSGANAAKAALDLLGEELLGRQRALDLSVFTRLESGQVVTADEALQIIHQKYAVWKIVRSLEQKLRAGQGAARVLGPMMDEGEEYHGA